MRTLCALVLFAMALGCDSSKRTVKNTREIVIIYVPELEECGNPYVFLYSCDQTISDSCIESGEIVNLIFTDCNGSYRYELLENDKIVIKGQYKSTDSIKQDVFYFFNKETYEIDSMKGLYLYPAKNGIWLNFVDSIVETYSNGYLTSTSEM